MTGAIDRYITAQVTFWKKQREQLHEPIKSNKLPFITISREYGCNGYQIAEKLWKFSILKIQILHGQLITRIFWKTHARHRIILISYRNPYISGKE